VFNSRYLTLRLTNPLDLNHASDIPSVAGGLPLKRHQPLPLRPPIQARHLGTPSRCRKSAIGLVRLHCLSRRHRSFRRIHSSRRWRWLLHSAWRKKATQPVRNELSSPITCSMLTPRLRRVICLKTLPCTFEGLGCYSQSPAGQQTVARNFRSTTGATALLSRLTRNLSFPSRNFVTLLSTRCPAASDCT
jgi:hypothetical protein